MAGVAGTMYGGNLPRESEKKSTHQPAHSKKNPIALGRNELTSPDRLNRNLAKGKSSNDHGRQPTRSTGT